MFRIFPRVCIRRAAFLAVTLFWLCPLSASAADKTITFSDLPDSDVELVRTILMGDYTVNNMILRDYIRIPQDIRIARADLDDSGEDEILLLNHSAMMVDGAYHELYHAMRPGFKENEAVGLVNKYLYDNGSEYVEGVNAISGERCSPHPHVFSDRALRPGDPVYYDILPNKLPVLTKDRCKRLIIHGQAKFLAKNPGVVVGQNAMELTSLLEIFLRI